MDEDFCDIPISDVLVTCRVVSENGTTRYSAGIEYTEALPLSVYCIWATESGVPMGVADFEDINGTKPPPYGCFQVLVPTDQRAMWGRKCPKCSGYWRTNTPAFAASTVCCYCGSHFAAHECLSDAQLAYVREACSFYMEVLEQNKDGFYKVSTRTLLELGIERGMPTARPEFFVERSKQTKFTCTSCGNLDDILGRYGFCSSCGTRNDAALLELDISALRNAVNSGGISPATALKEAVDGFDVIGRNIARLLCKLVPMTARRRAQWQRSNFAQLDEVTNGLGSHFDIDLFRGIAESERAFARRMFHRRHLYTHRGGIADQKYLSESGDTGVEEGQLLKENQEDLHRLFGSVARMGRNLLIGFHELFPPNEAPIIRYRESKASMGKRPPHGR